ncbi:hypothetical protein EZS27_017587 [termite gut metagenome]|uniref:Uncharacterized protein n=1 Tax=termite gut metagenome TaxID=433724 RepID=A0A5J4RKD8_9ZZZZ
MVWVRIGCFQRSIFHLFTMEFLLIFLHTEDMGSVLVYGYKINKTVE